MLVDFALSSIIKEQFDSRTEALFLLVPSSAEKAELCPCQQTFYLAMGARTVAALNEW